MTNREGQIEAVKHHARELNRVCDDIANGRLPGPSDVPEAQALIDKANAMTLEAMDRIDSKQEP